MKSALILALGFLGSLISPAICNAADLATAGPSLLALRCAGCHQGKAAGSNLDLTSIESALIGGRSGPALKPGRSKESLILKRVEAGEMPPSGALSKPEVELLRAWIDAGAPWNLDQEERRGGKDWWSLQPLRMDEPPAPQGIPRSWSASPIDRWVYSGLAMNGLKPSDRADPRVLIRRVTFDLTGLPPSPEEIDDFVKDRDATAYEKLIDRLLASPHYGERWARHWLDVVRFSESEGFERDLLRDHAWRYRDYVIRSLNQDKSYLRFAREQIAGDVMEPVTVDGIVATGLLVAGPTDAVGLTSAVARERDAVREDQLEEMVGVVSQTFLGMTANCARCHDHKFDPIPQRDYYRIRTALAGVWQPFADPESIELMPDGRALLTPSERARLDSLRASLSNQIEDASRQLGDLLNMGRDQVLKNDKAFGSSDEPVRPIAKWNFDHDTRDQIGNLHAALTGDAVLDGGRLRVKGDAPSVTVATPELNRDVKEKTLEAWLLVRKTPEKTGVTVFRIQSKTGYRGAPVDGIRYAGGEKKQWHNLSTAGFRTENLNGPGETAAEGELVHVAIVYDFGNSIRVYRNGQPYGATFQPDPSTVAGLLQLYPAGDASIRLTASQTFDLDEARLYDRALSASQIKASFDRGIRSVSPAESLAKLDAVEQNQVAQLRSRIAELQQQIARLPALEKSFAAVPRNAGVGHVLIRGDVERKGDVVAPGGLSCVHGLSGDLGLAPDSAEADRRRALAEWITNPDNPLFARVMVNRVWHYHFGAGLAENPNDLGFNGGRPSHPELLDWLAREFIANNWSLKKLHRTILLSETYRQSSKYNAQAAALDSSNRLLWRYAPRRLEAEAVRDSMLAVSGILNEQVGGESFRPFVVRSLGGSYSKYEPKDSAEPNLQRRTIYRMAINSGGDPMLDSLDCPVPSVKSPKRPTTTTALQALSLMNNAQTVRLAKSFAQRVTREISGHSEAGPQIVRAFNLALGRPPDAKELDRSRALVTAQGLDALAWGLFNTSEFLYVE